MAKEYIEREALLKDIQAHKDKGGLGSCVAGTLERYVKRVPTADVVEVVRCCTCKYSEAVGDIGCHCQNRKTPWFNDEFEVYMNLDDFCSYGERKEK